MKTSEYVLKALQDIDQALKAGTCFCDDCLEDPEKLRIAKQVDTALNKLSQDQS